MRDTQTCSDMNGDSSIITSNVPGASSQTGLSGIVVATGVRETTGLTQHDADKLAQQIFEMWMQSPMHRGDMMTASYEDYGFAFSVSSDGSVYGTLATSGLNASKIDFGN
ncbi:CAP domain-containing protein [Clostridium thermobutyricum]|uniref:CAP domain-containing protein n=1 Tax=Clostridium thermobutyricum TaxID=29372 RepID=UPI002943C17F|nr:CAP domain-containing protein [Clostridium thermobutyricum]